MALSQNNGQGDGSALVNTWIQRALKVDPSLQVMYGNSTDLNSGHFINDLTVPPQAVTNNALGGASFGQIGSSEWIYHSTAPMAAQVAAHSLTLADSLGHYVYGILGGMFITTTDYASEGLISIQFFGQYLVAPNN